MTTSAFGLPPGATEGDEVIYVTGPVGPTGATGAGVKEGGTAGQILSKASSANFDTTWIDPSISPIVTTTQTAIASQGGLLINIDSSTGVSATTATTGQTNAVEDEKFGVFIQSTGTNVGTSSGQFISGVPGGTGGKIFRYGITGLTNTGATFCRASSSRQASAGTVSLDNLSKNAIPVKPNTKYRLKIRFNVTSFTAVGTGPGFAGAVDTYTSAGVKVRTSAGSMSAIASTGGFINEIILFTTGATETFIQWLFYCISGNGSVDIDYNAWTLEEIVEPVTNSIPYSSSSSSIASFIAAGSTDNVDQSLDTTFVAVNTYIPPVSISETVTNLQTFVPTKSKVTRIGIYPVAKGTGNWTVTIHDVSNVVQASVTIANASLTNGVVNYFNAPCNLTALASYHFHVTSTVADGTVRVGTASDLETVSYIQNYYKPTDNFRASQNNQNVSISTDEDGFLEASKIDLTTRQFTFDIRNVTTTSGGRIGQIFQNTTTTGVVGNTFYYDGATYILLEGSTTYAEGVVKVKIPGGLTNITINALLRRAGASYSTDGASYTTMLDNTGGSTATPMSYTIAGPITTLYIKLFSRSGGGTTSYFGSPANPFTISATVDTSSLSTLRNHPTNKDIIKQYSTTIGSATTSATYRATKWGFPAIEYSATEYQFLDVDTTATGSTVTFSELGSIYTTVSDGGSIAIDSTTTPNIFVKLNITANRLYLSSNCYNATSDKDGSMKQSVVYQVVQ